ncbi:regulatory protein ral2 [Cryptococcus neoformans Tu259-1]|uniref:Regulatory protein ral2 n=1 Tax=Cryptococcus neoformans Tu259-1 TaxID=1230072 RepID=A0A854QQS3_CRYNE|nr:regulatory protein ral2 [Cryptococcus neoformans var. grubii Tu259-1]
MDAGTAHVMSWSEPTKGHVPPPLTGPSITISPLPAPHPPTVFLFGGKSVQTRRLTSDMWAMDLGTRIWGRVDAGPGPGPRYFHSMDVWEDKLVCFGGMSDSEPMSVHNDIWFFDCISRRWIPQPSPPDGVALGIDLAAQDQAFIPSARYAHLSAVSRGKLVISGGQHSDNTWIYEINVYDLKNRVWISKTEQPQADGMYSKGAYRSVAASTKKRVQTPRQGGDLKSATTHAYSVDEEGEGGDIWCYSNYDFAKVRRELDILSPDSSEHVASNKHAPPPEFIIRDESRRMRGSSQPPGLRFPTGGIVGNSLILCGLYLASVSAAFSIWALNLETMTWKHLEPSVLSTGSWNRALVWADKAKVLVFGNTQSDLTSDYSRRAVNLDHIAVISLEAFGIYQPPNLVVPTKVQHASLSMLDEKLASDFEVICDDGRRVKCSRKILSERWPWFADQEREFENKAHGLISDAAVVDINDTLLGSFNPARLAPHNLTLSEPFPVCVALIQYFYTLSLTTPLQNRAPVLSALLFMSKQYKIERLNRLVVHALHERLDLSNAVGIYEIATLSGEQCLQVRALNMIHSAKNGSSRGHNRQNPGSAVPDEGRANGDDSTPGRTQPGSPANGVPSGATRPGAIDAPVKRARADSLTIPEDIISSSPEQDTLHDDDDKIDALLAALDVSAKEINMLPRQHNVSHRSSDRSLTSLQSVQSPSSLSSIPQRSHMRLPPLAPPPLSRPPSFTHTRDSTQPEQSSFGRPSSPTNSDLTSNYPQTPSGSLRESWILPQHKDWSVSTGLGGGLMDNRSSSSSGVGLPALPEDDAFDPRSRGSIGRMNRDPFIDLFSAQKKPNQATLEAAGLLQPSTLQNLAGLQQTCTDSPTMHDYPYDSSFMQVSPAPSISRTPSVSSHSPSVFVPPPSLSLKGARHFSINTQSSGASNPLSPINTEWSEETGGPLLRAQTVTSLANSAFDCGSSISSGSTGTSSKKAAKAEAKAIRQAEKAAKKAEAQAHFEALRAERAKKMALLKAEAQRKAEIQAAKEQQTLSEKDLKREPKSKWGKLANGFKDAVLFPDGGPKSTMF